MQGVNSKAPWRNTVLCKIMSTGGVSVHQREEVSIANKVSGTRRQPQALGQEAAGQGGEAWKELWNCWHLEVDDYKRLTLPIRNVWLALHTQITKS